MKVSKNDVLVYAGEPTDKYAEGEEVTVVSKTPKGITIQFDDGGTKTISQKELERDWEVKDIEEDEDEDSEDEDSEDEDLDDEDSEETEAEEKPKKKTKTEKAELTAEERAKKDQAKKEKKAKAEAEKAAKNGSNLKIRATLVEHFKKAGYEMKEAKNYVGIIGGYTYGGVIKNSCIKVRSAAIEGKLKPCKIVCDNYNAQLLYDRPIEDLIKALELGLAHVQVKQANKEEKEAARKAKKEADAKAKVEAGKE